MISSQCRAATWPSNWWISCNQFGFRDKLLKRMAPSWCYWTGRSYLVLSWPESWLQPTVLLLPHCFHSEWRSTELAINKRGFGTTPLVVPSSNFREKKKLSRVPVVPTEKISMERAYTYDSMRWSGCSMHPSDEVGSSKLLLLLGDLECMTCFSGEPTQPLASSHDFHFLGSHKILHLHPAIGMRRQFVLSLFQPGELGSQLVCLVSFPPGN
jgi:hypothetical protein